jgi:hypothetical protein
MSNNYQAFTVKSPGGKFNVLKTEVGVCRGFKPGSGQHPEVKNFVGIWDTGATGTMISLNVVNALGLIPTGKTNVYTASGLTQLENSVPINQVKSIISIYFLETKCV